MGLLNGVKQRGFHQSSGESIRWWKAIPAPVGTSGRLSDGVLLTEQTINAAARFLVGSTSEDVESTQFGLIVKGTMQISAFPDWARFNHLDRVALIAPGRLQSAMVSLTRGSGASDALPDPYAMSITDVYVNGLAVLPDIYTLNANAVKWLSGAPSAGVEYAAEYLFAPRYIVLPQTHRTSPTDRTGASLPLHYWLQREQNT